MIMINRIVQSSACRPIISFIIPLYNGGKYIMGCVESINSSGFGHNEYEIVIVEDGSQDNSLQIATEIAEKTNNITLISQTNGGPGKARNEGVRNSLGKYVWFIDCDDLITKEIQKAKALFNQDIDIIGISIKEIDGPRIIYSNCQNRIRHNIVLSGEDAIVSGFKPASACALIVKRDFLIRNSIKFRTDLIHEDVEFSYRVVALSGSLYYTDLAPYEYIKRDVSRSSVESHEKIKKLILDDIYLISIFTHLAQSVSPSAGTAILRHCNAMTMGVLTVVLKDKRLRRKEERRKILTKMDRLALLPINFSINEGCQKYMYILMNFLVKVL